MAETSILEQPGGFYLALENLFGKGRYTAGLMQRFLAFQMDAWTITAIVYIPRYLATQYYFPKSHFNWDTLESCLFFAYCIGFELSPMQTTPCKRGFRLYVAATDGTRLPPWRTVLRTLLCFAFLVPGSKAPMFAGWQVIFGELVILVSVATVILRLIDPRRRMLHDLLTGAAVFRAPATAPAPST